jgi:hypothetical protein
MSSWTTNFALAYLLNLPRHLSRGGQVGCASGQNAELIPAQPGDHVGVAQRCHQSLGDLLE